MVQDSRCKTEPTRRRLPTMRMKLQPPSKPLMLSVLLILSLCPVLTGASQGSPAASWDAYAPNRNSNGLQPHFLSRLRSWARKITLQGSSQNIPYKDKDDNGLMPFSSEEDDAESDVEEKEEGGSNISPLIAGALDSLLSDPNRLLSWSLRAVQYSLIWYLSKAAWKAMNEVLEEINSQDGSNGDPLFCSRADVPRILLALENLNALTHSPSSAGTPPLPQNGAALQLAIDLQKSGMPLRASTQSSIESLLTTITKTEASILRQCLWKPPPELPPDEMWNQVVGLDSVKEQLLVTLASSGSSASSRLHKTQRAFAPLLNTHSSTSHHVGVLLYGEPGCGKSFLIRALAAKLRLRCLVVTPSVLMRKYVGETNLQVRSLFSLLPKLNPCMVVLDELDGLFRERHDLEHDASRELKTEFLQWLSGILTSSSSSGSSDHSLVVVGATNRPSDVDAAILRRLPQRFYVGLPDYAARRQLLYTLLSKVPGERDLDLSHIATQLNGYTPSDIHQVLQTAVRMGPLQEALQESSSHTNSGFRPLSTADILNAVAQTQPTPLSPRYRFALQQFASGGRGGPTSSSDSYSYTSVGNHHEPWGLHFVNMGTVQIPASDFLRGYEEQQQQQQQQHMDLEDFEEGFDDDDLEDDDFDDDDFDEDDDDDDL